MSSTKYLQSGFIHGRSTEFGRVVRAKARLVARGVRQRAGVEYFETYSPCPSVASIRLLAAIVCELGMDLCHFDAEQAFVQSELREDVYMRPPKGCGSMSGKMIKLCRSLYGLKQASRQWNHHLVRGRRSLGFEQCEADACVMRLVEAGAVSIVIVAHVDIFAMGLLSTCDKFCEDLDQFVPINNLGELRWSAGCRFSRDWAARTLTISQQVFAESTVAKFGVTRRKRVPAVVDQKLELFDHDEPDVDEPFRSLVGHLMWLANQTRPDILNAVRVVARYSAAPKLSRWQAALHIVMYIKPTSTYGIIFQRGLGNGVQLELYVDANYAHEANDRRSVFGGVIMCAGAFVCFYSRRQKSIALSSMEAEYVEMVTGVRETIFMRYLWSCTFRNAMLGVPR